MILKRKNLTLLCALFSFISTTPQAHAAKDDFDYRVPNEWLQSEADPSLINSSDDFTKSADHLLSAALTPLENHSNKMDLQGFSTLASNKWGVKASIFDLAVSTSGVLGLLIMKGTAAATVTWVPKKLLQLSSDTTNVLHTDSETSTIKLNGSEDNIETLIEPAVKSILATGKVKDELKLRENLAKITRSFHDLVIGIQTANLTQWNLSRLRFDLSVSATGIVLPFQTLGGGVKVRLEWYPNSKSLVKTEDSKDENVRKVQNQISSLIEKLAGEVEIWSQSDPINKKGLDLSAIRFGLGLTAKFNIALVKNSAGAAIYAYFSKKHNPPRSINLSSFLFSSKHSEPIDVITDNSTDENNERWEQLLFKTSQFPLSKAKKDPFEKLIQIKGEKFRKGLSRASRIGQFLVERSNKISEKSHWGLDSLKINFDLSTSGSLSLATLSGSVSTELIFKPLIFKTLTK